MTEREQAIERLRREKRALAEAEETQRQRQQDAVEQARRDGLERGARDASALSYTLLERYGNWWLAARPDTAQPARAYRAASTPPELPKDVADAAFAYEREHHVGGGRPGVADVVTATGPLATAYSEGWREAVGRFWAEVKDAL